MRSGCECTVGSSQQRSGAPPRPPPGMPRPAPPSNSASIPSPAKRARKDRGPNWNSMEISALIQAKRHLFLEELEAVDGRHLMNPDASKWVRISIEVMQAGCSQYPRDGPSCKTKWNLIISDYKKIADYFARSGTNGAGYWELTAADRKGEGLPRVFSEEVYFGINEWYGTRPSMNPPHTRDLLSTEDSNYQVPTNLSQADSDQELDDPMDIANASTEEGTDGSSRADFPVFPQRATQPLNVGINSRGMSPTASLLPRRRSNLPPGVVPQVLSSSDTNDYHPKAGNTSVRRKSTSGHNIIADATRASGEVMATQMKVMGESSRALEESKMELNMKLFNAQMDYHLEKDRLHQLNMYRVNDTARLAVERQSDVVKCLTKLSEVLSGGMNLPRGKQVPAEPQSAPSQEGNEATVKADVAPAPSSGQPSASPAN
jgi:hypothetical protein